LNPLASGAGPHRPIPAAEGLAVSVVPVDCEAAGQRIDNFLLARLKGVPRSHLYRVLRRGEVRVNKGRVKADYRLQAGDLVRIPPLRTPEPKAPVRAPDGQLARLDGTILYEDERLIVIDKPAGLAVHGGSGLHFGLIEALRQLRPGTELELVHRLDRDTSGCLLISKRRSTLRDLHASLRDGALDKRYLALLVGDLASATVTVDAPLAKLARPGGERLVKVDPAEGKPARTRFTRRQRLVLAPALAAVVGRPALTLVEAQLITGRTHQIRVHAAHVGAPLAGDTKYGDFEANRRLKGLGLDRLFLHAAAITLEPRHLARPLRVESPLPAELQGVLERLTAATTSGVPAP
jgi:23S rRNA pseudouridine955/2504/2580 synthase